MIYAVPAMSPAEPYLTQALSFLTVLAVYFSDGTLPPFPDIIKFQLNEYKPAEAAAAVEQPTGSRPEEGRHLKGITDSQASAS